MGEHGGKAQHAKALVVEIACEDDHILSQKVYRQTIVAPGAVDHSNVVIRCDLETGIPEFDSDGVGA
jgi:hypothetical protein